MHLPASTKALLLVACELFSSPSHNIISAESETIHNKQQTINQDHQTSSHSSIETSSHDLSYPPTTSASAFHFKMPSITKTLRHAAKHCTVVRPNEPEMFELNKTQRHLASISTKKCRDRLLQAQRFTIKLKNVQKHLADILREEQATEEKLRLSTLAKIQPMTTTEDDHNLIKVEKNIKHEDVEERRMNAIPTARLERIDSGVHPVAPIKIKLRGLRQHQQPPQRLRIIFR